MNRTEVCNLALSYLGKGRINSLEDASEEAKRCRVHYDHDRRRLLLSYPWGFARRIEKLAVLEGTVPGWQFCYGYPNECLRVQYVFDEAGARDKSVQREAFEVVTRASGLRMVATDVPFAFAEYVADVCDPMFFSEAFIDVLSHMLAASLALGLTGSANLAAQQMQLAQFVLDGAKFAAVLEGESPMRYPKKYVNARFS